MNTVQYYIILFFVLIISSCSHKGHEDHPHDQEEEVPADEIVFSKLKIERAGIELGNFSKRNLIDVVKANGVLDLPPQNKATVSSYVAGIVKDIKVIPGDKVKKGQILAYIEDPKIPEFQEQYQKALSNLSYAQKEYERQKQLFEEKVVAGKKFQEAETNYRSLQAEVESLKNKLSQLGISPSQVASGKTVRAVPVVSPIDGYVHEIAVNTGTFIEPAQPMFGVVDNSHIHVDLRVYESDISKVENGQRIWFTLTGADTSEYMAKIFAVGKAFDKTTKSVDVHAHIEDNKEHKLLPGMYVEARIQVGENYVNALP
ncbi:MAG TPA: efflux RND transporter periplasmic adaptor subunit, partial [Cytophagaceae bacterium]